MPMISLRSDRSVTNVFKLIIIPFLFCNVMFFFCNSICRLVNGTQHHLPVFNYKQSEGDLLLKFVTLPIIESLICKLHDFPVRLFLADGGMKMNYESRH